MSIHKKAWITHSTLWASYFILLLWFYSDMRTPEATFVKSIFIVGMQCLIFYLNYHLLLPSYYEKKKYLQYAVSIMVVMTVSLVLFYYFDRYNLNLEFRDGYRGGRGPGMGWRQGRGGITPDDIIKARIIQRHVMFNGFFIVIVLFISTILRNSVVSRKREQEAIELRSQMLEAESRMLKWQINPHFLFNTLNNIYYMTQVKSDKAPDAVHRLSEMLRYVIYDCNEKYVRLGQEISYLKGYLELQLLKYENSENIRYDFSSADHNLKIAPLLLITFVENSFKHSHIEDSETSWIHMELVTEGRQLRFSIENSLPENYMRKDTTAGIGLENVRRRLNLLYPDRHSLNLKEADSVYSVKLILDLDED